MVYNYNNCSINNMHYSILFFSNKISKSNKSEYQTEKISTNQQSQTINQSNEQQNSYTNNLRTEKQENADPNTTNTPESQDKENQQQTTQPKETQIATFTTKIYTKRKSKAKQYANNSLTTKWKNRKKRIHFFLFAIL